MGTIEIRLRHCMDRFESRTGQHVTYSQLAEATGLSEATIQSIGAREDYRPSLTVIEKLCNALRATPSDLLGWREE